jgi:hypothetical protein
LLEDLFEAGAGAAIGDELIGGQGGIAGAVDDVEEAELDGVGDGDAEVEVPRTAGMEGWRSGVMDWWIGGGRGRWGGK